MQDFRRGLRAQGCLSALRPKAIAVPRAQTAGATAALTGLTRAGDVILFENDLPDMYAEDNAPRTAAPAAA